MPTIVVQGAAEARRLAWINSARPNQIPPPGDWKTLLVLSGRGFGKTRMAMEDASWYALTNPGARIALVGETFSDARGVMVEGESGLLACLPEDYIARWGRTWGELFLTNGSQFKLYSGDRPDQLRGPQHHRAYTDELAKFQYPRECHTQLMFGLRLGDKPQNIVTTTPRPIVLLKELMERESTVVVRGSTFDNAANLSAGFLAEIQETYGGTRIGQQEISGEYLDEYEGALFSRDLIEASRYRGEPPRMVRTVVGIDPAASATDASDRTGLCVCGLGEDGLAYVLYSTGVKLSPDGWAKRAVGLYHEYEANLIVAEKNQGGDMVAATLATQDSRVPVKLVHASKGKRLRAEPVAALFEQGKAMMAGSFETLEEQMSTYLGEPGEASPDELDAVVYSLTELMLSAKPEPRVRLLG